MPSLKMTLKILVAVALFTGLGLSVVSGPANYTFNPLGTHSDGANWELKESLTPVHVDPEIAGQPTQEQIEWKAADRLEHALAHRFPADLKACPDLGTGPGKGSARDAKTVLFFEGFEGTVPPAGWTAIVTNASYTWQVDTYSPYEGLQDARCPWNYSQDESMVTPAYDLSTGPAWIVDMWWMGSYYWSVSPYDNCDLKVSISNDGSTWTQIWSEEDAGSFANWTWTNAQIPLTPYLSYTTAQFKIEYVGNDGADFEVGAFGVNDAAPPTGRCCYGTDFLTCADGMTEADCGALSGHWAEGLNCVDNPCPTVPPNDDWTGATVISTFPSNVCDDNYGATVDCPGVLDWQSVWYAFQCPYAENDIDVNYCGTVPAIQCVGVVVYADPVVCSDYILYSGIEWPTCPDANVNPHIFWNRLPGPATYYFPVAMLDGTCTTPLQQDFCFDVNVVESAPLPPGGSCGDPYVLSLGSADLPYTLSGMTTCGMSNDYANSCLGSYDGGEDWIMELTITNDMGLNVVLTTDASWVGFYIATDCGDAASCVAYVTSSGSGAALNNVPLTAGTYYIMVDTWPSPDCIPTFSLAFSEFTVTPGDNCADPFPVKLPDDMVEGPLNNQFIDNNTTCGRGNDYSNSCLGSYDGGEDMIYELDVAEPMIVDIALTTSDTWTGIAVEDECGDDASCVAYATGSSGNKLLSAVELDAGFYYIILDTWPSPNCIGAFTLTISPSAGPPPGDHYADCIPVGDVSNLAFTTLGASFDGPGGCMTSPNIWFCYTATCNGLATFSLCGSSYDTKIAVYDGTDPFTATMLGCNDDYCGVQSQLETVVTAGNTYLVEVGGYSSYSGDGVISISCMECPPDPSDHCENVTPIALVNGVPQAYSGDNTCADADCPYLAADGYTWAAFTIGITSDVYVDYCGLSPAWGNGFIVMIPDCPCGTSDTWNYATDWEFTSCGDGNVTIHWNDLPAGTWYYPVMRDAAYSAIGPYTIHITAFGLSTLTVDPSSVDFGTHPTGSTGSQEVTMTVGGPTAINYNITYTYSKRIIANMPTYNDLGAVSQRPDAVGTYVNPGTKQGGDTYATAFVIPGLPFYDTGTTVGYNNDYDEVCPYTGSTAPDVVYVYNAASTVTVNIDLCDSGYDTKVYVYQDAITPGAPYACNDDNCPGYRSLIEQLVLNGGHQYIIVIDGYGSSSGAYDLKLEEYVPPPPFQCPPSAGQEPENCGDDTDGGCNSTPPEFATINCQDTICGTAWSDPSTRDTDWYRFQLYQQTTITLYGQAEFPFIIGFVDTSDCGLASQLNPYAVGNPGDIVSCSRVAGPGLYWAFVAYSTWGDYPCGDASDYWIYLDCPIPPALWLSAAPESGTLPGNSSNPLTVSFNAADLDEGDYYADVVINHDGAKGVTTIPCHLKVGTTAPPTLAVDPTSFDFGTVHEGETGSGTLTLSNVGGGTINFALALDYGAKNIAGSYVETGETFDPGQTSDITLDVWNNSPDYEYMTGIQVTFPTGVTLNSAGNLLGEASNRIVYVYNFAPPVVQWGAGGTNYSYGYMWDEDWAHGNVNLSFDAGLSSDVTCDYHLWGDVWGGTPHELTGTFDIPIWLNPATHWLTVDPMAGTLPPDVPATVTWNSTDLPGGVYHCDIVVVDDTKAETRVPVVLRVYEWDHVALDPDPVLAIEQNATDPHFGHSFIGELYDFGGNTIYDAVSATVNGLPATLSIGSHPLVEGAALDVEFSLNDFAAGYGWPTGDEVKNYTVHIVFADASTADVTDAFHFLGHISGDVDLDGQITISDLVFMVTYMFGGGQAPQVMTAMDVNGDCTNGDIADLVYLVNYMFGGGTAPAYCPNPH